MLSSELLEDLEERWRTQGAPIAASLRPGLSDSQIDSDMDTLGLRLPEEARIWWRWHDGVDPGVENEPTIGFTMYSLGNAIRALQLQHEVGADLASKTPEMDYELDWWPDSYFPVFERGGELAIDCRESTVSPLFWLPTQDSRRKWRDRPRAESLEQVVSWWIEAMDRGIIRWNSAAGAWQRNNDRVPAERRSLV